mgnify:CR=1 FL=1
MKKHIYLPLVFLVVYAQNFAQSKRLADRYFEEFAYIKAATLYESLYKKGDTTLYILRKLGDAYYNNAETIKAEFWYRKMFDGNDSIDKTYLFKYAQVLRSNGKYKQSDSIFLKISKKKDIDAITTSLANQNYLIDYSKVEGKRISLRNLAINTSYSDFGGFIDNEEFYFASSSPKSTKKEKLYQWNNQPFLNIYKAFHYSVPLENSERDSILILEQKSLLQEPINSQYHESTPVFTQDGKTMYFTRVNYDGKKLRKDKKKTVNLKLYKAHFNDGQWGDIQELPFNSDSYSVGHPALSSDEKTLYFVSDMPGGHGETDIYKVVITDTEYGLPINLGNQINTYEKEMFPFVGQDSTLYFSSSGHLGVGLLDIYQTKILSDSAFSEVKNLGYPFNSKKDDFSFYLDRSGRKGYFSSNRPGGKGDDDVYSFIIYDDPMPVVVCQQGIVGNVKSTYDSSPIAQAKVKLIDEHGEVVQETYSSKDGHYEFEALPCTIKKYIVNVTKEDFKPDNKHVISSSSSSKVLSVNTKIKPLIVGDQIVINPIYFDYSKSNIREDAQYELEDIVTVLNNHPEMIIRIESHTDSRGRKDYNRWLSDKRAKATKQYIVSRGIKAERIANAIGYGEDKLLNDCSDAKAKKCTDKEHQLNRRSYYYIVKKGEIIEQPSRINSIKKVEEGDKRNKDIKSKSKSKVDLLEKLLNFKRGRSRGRRANKCIRDSNCG